MNPSLEQTLKNINCVLIQQTIIVIIYAFTKFLEKAKILCFAINQNKLQHYVFINNVN